ncbi:MAG: hypothetical protein LBQ12_10645 [Deltaproteobacteria bacterium]|nr:hypothetical protein [Deltaproteobacteria bacterium]
MPGSAPGIARDRWGGRLDWLLILAGFVSVGYCYFMYLYRTDELIHADIATEILTGREMFRQKTIFLSQYYHSTEMFLVRSSMFMALWTFLTDDMIATYSLAVATDIALMAFSFAYMARRLGAGPKATAFGILAFFGSRTYVSGLFTGMGGSSYGTMCATVFIVIGYYAASRLGKRNRVDTAMRFVLPVLAFLFGLSSMRFLATVFVPLIAAHAASKLWSRLPSDWRGDRLLGEMLAWTALSAIGAFVTKTFIVPLGFGPFEYQTLAANGLAVIWTEHFPELIKEIASYNPAVRALGGFSPATVAGATGLSCLGFYAACAWGLASTTTAVRPARVAVYRFLLLSLAVATLAMMLLFTDVRFINLRYLVFGYVLMALVAALFYEDLLRSNPAVARAFLCLSSFFFALNSVMNVKDIPAYIASNPSRVVVRHTAEIEAALSRHGIKRAYSLYWNSSVETVLTNARVEVSPVMGNMGPLRYLTNYETYSPERAGDRTAFLMIDLLPDPAFAHLPQFNITNRALLDTCSFKEIIPDPEADIEIMYFDRNPFTFPPGHDPADEYSPIELAK